MALQEQSHSPLTLPEELASQHEILLCSLEGFYLKTPQGVYNSKIRSSQEAKKNIEMWVRKFGEPSNSVVIGLELGYHTLEILSQCSACRVWVFEPSWDTIIAACQVQDFSRYIREGRLHIFYIPSDGNISSMVLSISGESFNLFVHRPTYQHNQETVLTAKQQIESIFQMKSVNTHTIDFFHRLWIPHILRNFEQYLQHPSIDALIPYFEKNSVVIVAAGPSLERNIHILKDLSEAKKCIIISVNTVVPRLYKEGILPDIVVAVDPQSILYHNFTPLFYSKGRKPILVAHPLVSPTILRNYPGPIFFWESPLLSSLVPEGTPQKIPLDMGGSVATAAYILATQLSAKNITFLGLDLAYEGQAHVRGNIQDYLFLFYESSRWKTWEDWSFRKGRPTSANIPHQGFFGKDVWIDHKFQTYIEWLENRLTFYSDTFPAYNCTEGGIAFRSIPNLPFDNIVPILSRHHATSPEKIPATLYSANLLSVEKNLRKTMLFFESSLNTLSQIMKRVSLPDFKISSEEQSVVQQLLDDEWMTLKIRKPFADFERERKTLDSPETAHMSSQWTVRMYHILLTVLEENLAILQKLLPLFTKR